MTDPKQAEIDYPAAIGEEGRAWLRNKPFHHDPRMTSRLPSHSTSSDPNPRNRVMLG